jgi:hypothetical protein
MDEEEKRQAYLRAVRERLDAAPVPTPRAAVVGGECLICGDPPLGRCERCGMEWVEVR